MNNSESRFTPATSRRWLVHTTLLRAAQIVGIRIHGLESIEVLESEDSSPDTPRALEVAGNHIGLQIVQTVSHAPHEVAELLRSGMTAILLDGPNRSLLLIGTKGSRFDAELIENGSVQWVRLRAKELAKLINNPQTIMLAVKPLQDCDSLSANPVFEQVHAPATDHGHISPLQRLWALARMERRDINVIAVFAAVSVLLSLATPLTVETLVNVASWGVYVQPLFVLVLALLASLILSTVFVIMQYIVVEILQQRQFVRIVNDLAHRFPIADRHQLKGTYPRELANRVLDIKTVQKAAAALLLDGINVILVTLMGLALLSLYHAYLLGLVVALLFSMTVMIWLLGRGGVTTSIEESKVKYQTVHWLQDVLNSPNAFRTNGGGQLSVGTANYLATQYIYARKRHFRVLLRQVIFVAGLQTVALTGVLGIGGWLVIQGEMNLGQLVAAELVVTLVMGTFSKAGKSIEVYYDLMAALDKVGHLLDLEADANDPIHLDLEAPLPIQWTDLKIVSGLQHIQLSASQVEAGSLTALLFNEPLPAVGQVMSGSLAPIDGTVSAKQIDVRKIAVSSQRGLILGFASEPEPFNDSIIRNIDLGREFIGREQVRNTLMKVDLLEDLTQLPSGMNTYIQSDGYPLSPVQLRKMMLARALVAAPRLLIVDGILDLMPQDQQLRLLDGFRQLKEHCTILLITQQRQLAEQCDRQIEGSLS